jgi:antitoxin HigA-1
MLKLPTIIKETVMAVKNGLPPIHPGVFLKEILDELGLFQNVFAHAIGVSPMRISHVVHGTRPVTAELAILFGKVFNQSPLYWLNLQTSYDLKITAKALARRVSAVRPLYGTACHA